MPKIAEKAKVLGGRADVVRYASGTSSGAFFYREWNRSTKSYRTRRIEEATTLSEAVELATDIAFALREEENSSEAEDDISSLMLSTASLASSVQAVPEELGCVDMMCVSGFVELEFAAKLLSTAESVAIDIHSKNGKRIITVDCTG